MQPVFRCRILIIFAFLVLASIPCCFSQGNVPALSGQATTLLSDGHILATGGTDHSGNPVNDAYLVDASGSPIKLSSGLLHARTGHSATTLPDGTVLIFGGVDGTGNYVRSMEIFDPRTEQFTPWTGQPLVPRSGHTATLLTDGRLVIIGGKGEGGTFLRDIQYWDYRTGSVQAFDISLIIPRQNHSSTLLSDGRVLITDGIDAHGLKVAKSEIFDPTTNGFSVVGDGVEPLGDSSQTARISGSIPLDGTSAFPIQNILSLRFSKLINVHTASSQTVVLENLDGVQIPSSVVAAGNGRLVFVTPDAPLAPGSDYDLAVKGVADQGGAPVLDAAIRFHTEGDVDDGSGDGWAPDSSALAGDWGTRTGQSRWQNLPPMSARSGVTALAGQVLGLSGKPLSRVTLQIESQKVTSDETGRFILTDLSPGHHVLVIDGRTANRGQAAYGLFEAGVDVKANVTNVLNYTIWMTKLDTADAIQIPSPTNAEDTVITTPLIPGLELHLPANTTIVDYEGHPVTSLTITPIPLDKPPFPLPTGVKVPVYFTIQPGGSQINIDSQNSTRQGARLYYPNTYKERPGTLYNFWNYDATSKGWYIYGTGHVSPDWAHITPDPGVEIYELTGAMVGGNGAEPAIAPSDDPDDHDGDPVDLSTGEFVYQKTDLFVADTIPIELTHTYISNDHYQRAFGIGTTDNYDIFLVGDTNPYTWMDLVLPTGSRVRFSNTAADGSWQNAFYISSAKSGPWYGATMHFFGSLSSGHWTISRTDGMSFTFPDSQYYDDQVHQALTQIRYLGWSVTLTRDANANLTTITTSTGRSISLQRDAQNRITQASDNSNRTVHYSYDSAGHLQTVTDANNGVTTFAYNGNDQMTTIQDARQITYLTNQYDSNGRVHQQTMADGGTYVFNWTPSSYVSQQWISSANRTAIFNRYDSTQFEGYTGLVSQVSVTDPRGYVHQVVYNNLGKKTSDTFALGQTEQQAFTYQHYGDNLLNSVTDPLGRKTSFDYDSSGNLIRSTRLDGTANAVTSTYGYLNGTNHLAWATDPLGHSVSGSYDANRQVLQTATDSAGNSVQFTYNAFDQLISASDGLNHTTTFGYTGDDLTSITDALGNTTNLTRDAIGRLTGVTDPQGHQTSYAYDNLDEITSTTDALQNTTSFVFDPNGNLKKVTDALQHATNYTYDNMDRLLTQTDPLLRQESYTYDLGGNIATFTDRKGQKSNYTFDGLGRMIAVAFGVQPGSTDQSNIAFTYDAGNRMTRAVDSTYGTLNRGFDGLDHLMSESGPQGSIAYTYDNAGRRSTMQVTGQPQVNYAWDSANRLSSITQGANSVGFSYDAAGRRTSLTLPNGIVANYTYDADSHLAGISYNLGGTPVGDLSYTYDSLGHRISMAGSLASMNLPQPITSTMYDAANELTNLNGVSYTYDANGNMANDGIHSYGWNSRNQLASIDSGGTAAFAYDPLGRRSSKMVSGVGSTTFLYDRANPTQELNGSTPTANMLESGVDEYLVRTDSSGTYNYVSDALGSTLALSDANGISQAQYSYDAFGRTTQSGTSTTNTYAYTGREVDVAGLSYYRARYYNPATGRFISEDPAGFGGSGTNLYAYAYDSPLNFVDPSGLNVTIALYTNGANGEGHVGVGVNTSDTYGYYPDYKTWCVLAGCGMPGSLDRDATRSASEGPVQYLTIPTTPAQDQAMQAAIDQWNHNKGEWSLYGRNCARYAEHVLNAGGIPNVPDDVIPKNLFHDLQQMYPDTVQQYLQGMQNMVNARGAGVNILLTH